MTDWKQKLKKRTQEAVETKDSRGLGRKSVLDLSLIKLPLWLPHSGKDKNVIDIMPWRVTQPWYQNLRNRSGEKIKLEPGDCDYKLEIARHNKVGPGQDHMLCLREAFGKTDSICEEMFAEYQKRKDGLKDFDEKKARAFQPSWRDFYIIYDYDDPNKGFQLWEVSFELFEKYLLEEMKIKIDEGGLIIPWDLLDGRTIVFKGREKTLGLNKYIEAESIDFEKRDSYAETVLDELPSLDQALIVPTYEEIKAAHYGLEDEGVIASSDEKAEVQSSELPSTGRTRMRGVTGPVEVAKELVPSPEPGVRTREAKAEQIPPPVSDVCPAGGKFGYDCNKIKACQDQACSDDIYQACLKEYDQLSNLPKTEQPKSAVRKRGVPAPAVVEPLSKTIQTETRTRRR